MKELEQKADFGSAGAEQVRAIWRVTLVGALVNALLAGLKGFLGVVGNSQALIADAVHSVSDLLTDAIVLYGVTAGRKAADDRHPFGHGRIETVSSAVLGVSLLTVALFLVVDAVHTLRSGSSAQPGSWALAGALISIVGKELLYRYTVVVGKSARSPAVVANAWHHRSDALSSIAVLVGVAIALIQPEWRTADAWAAIVVALLVARVGWGVVWSAYREMTDTAPDPDVLEHMSQVARGVDGVIDVHDLKVRMSAGLYQMELHVAVDGNLTVSEGHHIAKCVERRLRSEFEGIASINLHVDPRPDHHRELR